MFGLLGKKIIPNSGNFFGGFFLIKDFIRLSIPILFLFKGKGFFNTTGAVKLIVEHKYFFIKLHSTITTMR
jgi:hypothetical protein